MIPEAVVAMLACARLGAPHTVVFGGFSADALATRILDCGVEVVITADGGNRRGAASALKPAVDKALERCPDVRHVLVIKPHRPGRRDDRGPGRLVGRHRRAAVRLSTSASSSRPSTRSTSCTPRAAPGKPKGILHTTGGYLVGIAYTHWASFDLKAETDVFWTAADIGWVTGHSYLVYGPLANGATSVMYEGTPDTPHKGRWWEIIEKYRVTILYCAPTAIRTFMKWGSDIPRELRPVLAAHPGLGGRADQPGGVRVVPALHRRRPYAGGRHLVADRDRDAHDLPDARGDRGQAGGGDESGARASASRWSTTRRSRCANGSGGYLVVTQPWPAMLRTIWGDDQRYIDTYWSRFPGLYFAGDGAKKDEDGDLWLLGRVDDVMNVSGHRMSTTEIESALVSHPKVAEAAVVGATDETTGQAIVAFVILRADAGDGRGRHRRGAAPARGERDLPIAKPRQIMVVEELPKTRSGKIMRRLLRDIAENRELGDVTTLTDSTVMDLIKENLAGTKPGADED